MLSKFNIYAQYRNAEKLNLFNDELLDLFQNYSIDLFVYWYYIDTATGYQLDNIGEIIGFPRPYNFVSDALIWGFGEWETDVWGTSVSALAGYLDDDDYRKVLKVVIGQQLNPITVNNVYQILEDVFGAGHLFKITEGEKTFDIYIPASMSATDLQLLRYGDIIKAPQGVSITYSV